MSSEIMRMDSGFTFEGHPVRVIMVDEQPWWVAKDVAEALGYTWSGTSRVAHVPEQWRGVTTVVTHNGEQEMITLSEQGLYFFLGRSDKQSAIPFQMWIAGEVVPSIRRTGAYGIGSKKLSATQMFILQAHAFAEQERLREEQEQRARAIEAETRAVVTRVDAIEARAAESEQQLKGIEAPGMVAREMSTQAMINRIVRGYCIANHVEYADAYKTLYREFRDRYGIDIPVRARNRGMSAINLAARDGLLDSLHAVAYRIFVEIPELEAAERDVGGEDVREEGARR